jgi:hypothetical protein
MPEAMAAAVLFKYLNDLEVPAEYAHDIAPGKRPPIGSLGNMPPSVAAAKKGKLRAEDRKDIEASRSHES